MTDPTTADRLRDIAARVDRAPSVARRTAGALGVAASYLPGERIPGVRVVDDTLHVHVVMVWDATVDDVRRDVLSRVADAWDPLRTDLTIEDIEVPA